MGIGRARGSAIAAVATVLLPVLGTVREAGAASTMVVPGAPSCAVEVGDDVRPGATRYIERMAAGRDGRFVVIDVSDGPNGPGQLSRIDRTTGSPLTLLGFSHGQGVWLQEVSDDGRWILAQTETIALNGADTNGTGDLYLIDATTQTAELVSRTPAGVAGNRLSNYGAMSADGRYVAFMSEATDLVPGTPSFGPWVFLRDRVAGTTVRLDALPAGWTGLAVAGLYPQISSDGRYVRYRANSVGRNEPVVFDRITGAVVEVPVPFGMVWSDDGLHAYRTVDPAGASIQRLSWATGQTETISVPAPYAFAYTMAVSPSERYLLVGAQRPAGLATVTQPFLVDRTTGSFTPVWGPRATDLRGVAVLDDGTVLLLEDESDPAALSTVRRVVAVRHGLGRIAFGPGQLARGRTTQVAVSAPAGTTIAFPSWLGVTWDSPAHEGATLTVAPTAPLGRADLTVTGATGCVSVAPMAIVVSEAPPPPPPLPVPVVSSVTGVRALHPGWFAPFTVNATGVAVGATTVDVGPGVSVSPSVMPWGVDVGATVAPDAPRGRRTVTVSNGAGKETSVADAVVVRDPFGEFQPIGPQRMYDSRDPALGGAGPLRPGEERTIQAWPGAPGGGVSAVVVNVTGIDPTSDTYLTVFPAGVARPLASNLNLAAGRTAPNLVAVGTDDAGRITIYNHSGTTDVAVDIVGYHLREQGFGLASAFLAFSPERVLDTRVDLPRELRAREYIRLPLVRPGSPVRAAVLNVTVTDTTASSFLSVVPADRDPRFSSNLNWTRGMTVANQVVVPVGPDGRIDLYNHAGSTHVIVDILGLYDDGTLPLFQGQFGPTTPVRLLDTRVGTGGPVGAVAPGAPRRLSFDAVGAIPTDAVAVVLNMTATEPAGPGYLTAYPAGQTAPLASNLNYVAGATVPNLVVVPVSADGAIEIAAGVSPTHVIADLVGWFAPAGHLPPGANGAQPNATTPGDAPGTGRATDTDVRAAMVGAALSVDGGPTVDRRA